MSDLDKVVEQMNDSWADPNKVGGKYMAGVIADFAPALKEIAKLGSMNNKPNGKYERGSWKLVENPDTEYHDAFWRHILEGRHEIDEETGMPHDVAIAWNALALICFRLEREKLGATVAAVAVAANREDLTTVYPWQPTTADRIFGDDNETK